MINNIKAVILAAGNGKRIRCDYQKVLLKLGGIPLIKHIINSILSSGIKDINIVHNNNCELLKKKLSNFNINWILQQKQLGTGNAVFEASNKLKDEDDLIIFLGDVPLISSNTIKKLLKIKNKKNITLITAKLENPLGYGRIIRNNGIIVNIIEDNDANNNQLKIKEINTGILFINNGILKKLLIHLNNKNIRKEYYITNIISIAIKYNYKINSINPENNYEIFGVNNLLQLSKLEKIYQKNKINQLLKQGVIIADIEKINIYGELVIGKNVFIDVNVVIKGKVNIGNNVHIGIGCVINDSTINDNCIIKDYSILNKIIINSDCIIGPFVNLRPNTELKKNSKIGNFVELKKTVLGENSKIGHLSYIGDSKIGKNVNIGAGTITCNYNGKIKNKTIICDDVFIGSGTQLIAPVTIATGSTIGAGTTITKNTNKNTLVISRSKQKTIKYWKYINKK